MDSARAIRWCSTMADAPRMDHKQLRRSKKLIRKLCCNYDHGNCLALDDGEPCVCVQGISYSLLCNWFRNAVLPADHELLADVMRERPGKRCAVCGKPVYSSSNRAKYCPVCAKQERRKQDAKRKREQLSSVPINVTSEELELINPETGLLPNVADSKEFSFLLRTHRSLSVFAKEFPKCHFGRLVHLTAHAEHKLLFSPAAFS